MPKQPTDKPTAQERAALVARLKTMGFKATDLAALIKSGMTRRDIRDTLIARLRG